MSINIDTPYPGHRIVFRDTTKLGHVTGDYVIGFTAYEANGVQIGHFGRFATPAAAYEAIVNAVQITAFHDVVAAHIAAKYDEGPHRRTLLPNVIPF